MESMQEVSTSLTGPGCQVARPRNAIPSRDLHLMLSEQDAARLDLYLYSEAEQRIPFAAKQRFFTERLREYFERASLDLGLYFHELPPGSHIYAAPSVVLKLKQKLESLEAASPTGYV